MKHRNPLLVALVMLALCAVSLCAAVSVKIDEWSIPNRNMATVSTMNNASMCCLRGM